MKNKQKNNKKNLSYEKASYDPETLKIIKILAGVLIVFILTYFIAGLITGEIKFGNKDKKTETESVIQYDEIIVGEMFNRTYEEYYVILFNFTNNFASSYITYRDNYLKQDDHLPFYLIDLEKGFNLSYLVSSDEEINEYPENINDFKVKEPTVIKISNKKVVERIEGKDNILSFFQKLIEE